MGACDFVRPALFASAILLAAAARGRAESPAPLRLDWSDNMLTVRGEHLPGGTLEIWYLEAYCRPGSTDRDWRQTVIGHETELSARDPDGRWLELRCRLTDGVTVDHRISVGAGDDGDAIDFHLTAHNPTDQVSDAHWAQPCIRVDRFTGRGQDDYLQKSFVFIDGHLERMPVRQGWATEARYVPGQVWCPRGVDRNDVNPRPLSPLVPSNGLIGCLSADERLVMAVAWEPYQELFQGVAVCVHSDFRIGGLDPGETKHIRGKLYLTEADIDKLLARYRRDFPEHVGQSANGQ